MSDQDPSQERTEEPTPKRQREAREKGQVARSKELTTAIVVIMGSTGLMLFSRVLGEAVFKIFNDNFSLSRSSIFNEHAMVSAFSQASIEALIALLPLMILLFFGGLAATAMLGGLLVNFSSVQFKAERLDPIAGIKRIFSLRALMELVKALTKFLLIGTCAVLILWSQTDKLLSLSQLSSATAIVSAIHILGWSLLWLSLSLILIAAVDVPFQLWQNAQKLKMTHQEIKDEMKDTEGRPEVKQKLRQMQQQIARGRMMEAVPKADVVITNPTHYAIALTYDMHAPGAPRVIAKSIDFLALQIQKVAKAHQIMLLEMPPLARSIYHTTEIDCEIPDGLYVAVAQVLAYVYQLKNYKRGPRPKPPENVNIPDDLQH